MRVNKKEGKLLHQAINYWRDEHIISSEDAEKLSASYEVIPFDWKRLAKYAFWTSLVCILTAVSALLSDSWLIALLEQMFNTPDWIRCLFFTAIAATLFAFGARRKKRYPSKLYSNEAILFLGVLATAAAISFLGLAVDTGSGHFSLLILLATLAYGALGLWFYSGLIWVFALLSLGSWMGAETGYASGWGAYYLGMNYPVRFVLFGLLLIFCGNAVFKAWPQRQELLRPTRVVGLLYVFIALWILSIFGDYRGAYNWLETRQIELLHWSILFAAAALAAIYHGVRYDDAMTRGFGLTFLFINLYTRFFEYFWDSTHKAIFFALLALSFWYLGSRAEKIWNMEAVKKIAGKQ